MTAESPPAPPSRSPGDAPDPLWSRTDLPVHGRFECLGLAIEVFAPTPAWLGVAADAFGAAQARDAGSGGPVDLTLRLIAGPPAGGDGWPDEPPDRRPAAAQDGARGGGRDEAMPAVAACRPLFREHDRLFSATDGQGGMVTVDLGSGTAAAWFRSDAPPDRVRTRLIESALWRLATWRGLLALHAAAVVVDGVAVIARGGAGAGKSSVALAADRAGRPVLAEEVAWIDPLRWAVWPVAQRVHFDGRAALRRAMGVAEQTARRFRPARATAHRTLGDKISVALTTPRPTEPVPIGPFVLLDAGGDPSRPAEVAWHPIDAAAARTRCEAERIVGEHAQPPARWDAVVGGLCGGGAYELRGGDPAARAAALVDIVRRWRAADGPGGS